MAEPNPPVKGPRPLDWWSLTGTGRDSGSWAKREAEAQRERERQERHRRDLILWLDDLRKDHDVL